MSNWGQTAESPLNVWPDDTVLERGGAGEIEETVSLAMILQELREFRRDNSDQLKQIKEDIQKSNDRLEEAEEQIVGLEERLQNTENVMAEVLKLQTQLKERITDQEGHLRWNNIRIYGVAEEAEGNSPSMITFVEDMLREKLELETSLSLQIERAHRASLHGRQKMHHQDQSW